MNKTKKTFTLLVVVAGAALLFAACSSGSSENADFHGLGRIDFDDDFNPGNNTRVNALYCEIDAGTYDPTTIGVEGTYPSPPEGNLHLHRCDIAFSPGVARQSGAYFGTGEITPEMFAYNHKDMSEIAALANEHPWLSDCRAGEWYSHALGRTSPYSYIGDTGDENKEPRYDIQSINCRFSRGA